MGIEEIVFDAAAVFAIGIGDRGPPAAAGGGRPLGNKGASMIKPSQPPWQAMEMRPPPLVAAPPPLPKGKRVTGFSGRYHSPTARLSPTHNILRVTAFLHPLLSLTHWIFGSLMLPYKSSSHSAKYVRWCDSCSLATPQAGAQQSAFSIVRL